MASRIPSIAETSRDPGFPLAGLHISLLPAARVIVTEVSQLASDNRGGESVGFARRTWGVTPWAYDCISYLSKIRGHRRRQGRVGRR